MHALYVCVTQQHDPILVGLAALVCCLGAFAGFALGREVVHATETRPRYVWGAAGIVATASAIWATHFIAMLAFEPELPVHFAIGRTMVSYLLALTLVGEGACVIAFVPGTSGRVIGGTLIGLAISAMHYTGMSAYEVQGELHWDTATVVMSVVAGVVLSILSVLAAYSRSPGLRWCGPIAFVLAVCLDHFLGMSAVTVAFEPRVAVPVGGINDTVLAVAVANVALVIVGLSLAALWLTLRDRRQRASEARQLRDLADFGVEGLLLCQGDAIVSANTSLTQTLGGRREDLIGRCVGEVLPGWSADAAPTTGETDAYIVAAGERVPVRILGRAVEIAGKPHRVIGVRDQRERLRNDAMLRRLAHEDALTGLANRLSFTEALAAHFPLPANDERRFALILLDLDRFKSVNDTLGHSVGDELLRRVARRLSRAVRDGDIVARLGGDEFAILVDGGDLAAVRTVADDIVELIARPVLIEGDIVDVTASLGIAFAGSDGHDPAELSRNADLALYRAKHEGGGTYRLFEAEMNARVQARRGLEQDLRRAASREEFELYYQPQVDPRTGVYNGAEALIRWNHPQRGTVSPADFIPLAEEIGLIGGIGEWVLRTACSEALAWPQHLCVAVNLSPVQFRDTQLASLVLTILAETGLPGARLELEITESALLQDDGSTLATLRTLRAHGIRISMDDFGTGYSSLSYLRRFPFDKIKIDQSFMRQIPADADSVAIVQAVTSLGAKLGMTVTAEGVETVEQRAFAVSENCDQIQGYLISRPVTSATIRGLFADPTGRVRDVA